MGGRTELEIATKLGLFSVAGVLTFVSLPLDFSDGAAPRASSAATRPEGGTVALKGLVQVAIKCSFLMRIFAIPKCLTIIQADFDTVNITIRIEVIENG